MRWLLVVTIVLPLAQQPAKSPKDQGAAEANRAKSTAHAKKTEDNQTQPAQSTPVPAPAPVATESQRNAATTNDQTRTSSQRASEEDRSTQRKLTWFTGVLAAVGVLQLVVMFLTWLIYRRQANEMRRQRHEMVRQRAELTGQRTAMESQLETMKGQLEVMKGTGEQTDRLIKEAARQAEQLTTVAATGKISAEAAGKAADAARKSFESYQASERAWMAFTNVVYTPFFNATFGDSTERIDGNNVSNQMDKCGTYSSTQVLRSRNAGEDRQRRTCPNL